MSEVAASIVAVETVTAEVVQPTETVRPGRLRRCGRALAWAGNGLLGLVALIVGLAFASSVPLVQFISLGYLVEVSGRALRERDAWRGGIGLQQSARLGKVAALIGLWSLPIMLLQEFAFSAMLIEPDGPSARRWRAALIVCTVVIALHVVSALLRGGGVWQFIWPAPLQSLRLAWRFVVDRRVYQQARQAVWDTVTGLRLGYFFWLGLWSFVGALLWLVVPVTLLAAGRRAPLLAVIGGLLLTIVVMYVPFLQARLGASGRLGEVFALRGVRRDFCRAPLAYAVALLLTLALSLPLYLLKIEWVPREAAWLPGLLFVAFALPARWAVGWACARAARRESPRHFVVRSLARVLMLATSAAYALIVYFTQFTSWYGIGSLYEQHAFLLPVPFLGY